MKSLDGEVVPLKRPVTITPEVEVHIRVRCSCVTRFRLFCLGLSKCHVDSLQAQELYQFLLDLDSPMGIVGKISVKLSVQVTGILLCMWWGQPSTPSSIDHVETFLTDPWSLSRLCAVYYVLFHRRGHRLRITAIFIFSLAWDWSNLFPRKRLGNKIEDCEYGLWSQRSNGKKWVHEWNIVTCTTDQILFRI